MVQRVERFDTELQLMAARQRHGLSHAEIKVPRRRIAQRVARLHAKVPGAGRANAAGLNHGAEAVNGP